MGKTLIIKGADFSNYAVAADFTRLNWIGGSTSATSHIDSGIFWGNKVDSLEDELQFCATLDSTGLSTTNFYSMGTKVNSNTYCNVWFAPTQTTFYFANANVQAPVSLFDGSQHTILLNKDGAAIDSNTYAFSTPPSQYSGDSSVYDNIPIYLDSASKQNGNYYIDGPTTAMKIHWVKYYRGTTLILDAIPVRRNSDNVVCLYDKVSGNYLTRNDGSTITGG